MESVQQIYILVSSLVCRVEMPQLTLSNNIPLNTNQDQAWIYWTLLQHNTLACEGNLLRPYLKGANQSWNQHLAPYNRYSICKLNKVLHYITSGTIDCSRGGYTKSIVGFCFRERCKRAKRSIYQQLRENACVWEAWECHGITALKTEASSSQIFSVAQISDQRLLVTALKDLLGLFTSFHFISSSL